MVENFDYKDLNAFKVRPYRMKRLKGYCEYYSKPQDKVIFDDNVASVLNAQGFTADEAPRSIYKPEKLYEALAHYAPHEFPALNQCTSYTQGIALAHRCFARPKDVDPLHILPMTPETIDLITSNRKGSAGLTNWGATKAESMTRALERGLQTLKGEKAPEPCLAFKRTQFNDKTRLVWGYPYSMTAIEGLVAYPLNQRFKGGSTPMAFAIPSGSLGTKIVVASYHKEWCYSLDFSQFDASISSRLIHAAFRILRTWFDGHEVEPTSGMTVKEVFDCVEHYFVNTTIVMPDGNIYIGKDHGVPSGSYFTQMIDSVVNVIICGTLADHFHLNVDRHEIFVLGDDLMFFSNRKVDLDQIADYVNRTFGVHLHGAEKSALYHHDDTIKYLGRTWDNGLPSLSEEEVLKRMVYPENFRRYSKDPAERQRQVHMLLLSFASQYYCAWNIAFTVIDPSHANIHRGCANADVNVYVREKTPSGEAETSPEFMTGLQRYLRKYVIGATKGDIPITAMQYWL